MTRTFLLRADHSTGPAVGAGRNSSATRGVGKSRRVVEDVIMIFHRLTSIRAAGVALASQPLLRGRHAFVPAR
jgi:hypothetical protein